MSLIQIDFFISFVIQGFSSSPVDSLTDANLSRKDIEKSENRSLLIESMLKYLKSLEVVFIPILFRLLPLKFSRMINWRRWSEIKVVMWPQSYLKDGLFTKILCMIQRCIVSNLLPQKLKLWCDHKVTWKMDCLQKYYVWYRDV